MCAVHRRLVYHRQHDGRSARSGPDISPPQEPNWLLTRLMSTVDGDDCDVAEMVGGFGSEYQILVDFHSCESVIYAATNTRDFPGPQTVSLPSIPARLSPFLAEKYVTA